MNYDELPRVAVDCDGTTRHGFLLSEDRTSGFARMRFLKPQGWIEAEVPIKSIIGVHGKTFYSSYPFRPEVCERVTFIDHGRQRKGWVWDIERNGRVTLAVGDEFVERWVEELVLIPLGEDWQKFSERELDEQENGNQSTSIFEPANGRVVDSVKKGGEAGHHEELASKARRGAERLRELVAKVANTHKGA